MTILNSIRRHGHIKTTRAAADYIKQNKLNLN